MALYMPVLKDIEKRYLLEDRIYHRMAEVNLCASMANLLVSYGLDSKVSLVLAGRIAYESTSLKELSDPIIDTGIMMCRVLIEFLGVRCRAGQLLPVKGQQTDDISIRDFGLPFVPCSEVDQGHSGLSPSDVGQALIQTLSVANKGIGHLTLVPARTLELPNLNVACRSVLNLMNRHLYQALGYPSCTFNNHVGCWVKKGRGAEIQAPNTGPQADA